VEGALCTSGNELRDLIFSHMVVAGGAMVPESCTSLAPVQPKETADEEKFDCPQPWFLALLTVAMSAMTSITVAGALFFLLAAPEKVSPHCYKRSSAVSQTLCTASTVCFWTYPVVCCLFVVLVFAKNLVDQRVYYEFLIHKVVIGYGKAQPWKDPIVIILLGYALCAFSALVWHSMSQVQIEVSHVYSSLAYITPIISFLAVILAQWSIQGKLVTLPNFMENYDWAVQHLNECHCYYVDNVHVGYNALEIALEKSTDEHLDTPRLVALVEHYTQIVSSIAKSGDDADLEAKKPVAGARDGPSSPISALRSPVSRSPFTKSISDAERELVTEAGQVKEYVYWQVRLLFNPRLQDGRSQNFRNWALAYMVTVILAVMLSVYIYICCLITCLEIERVLVPGSPLFAYTHRFSLRPDLDHSSQSFKQMAASAAISFMSHGAKAFYNRASALPHFQIAAAA